VPDPALIPVNVITGPLGVGKTTAIARLLAGKPPHESWLVVLNEFTDSGIDVVTLAGAARGSYDLRMIPGGCLCCTGEADFRQQLSAVLAQDAALWPRRILIEPSGIGHPGAMVEELRLFARSGALELSSIIALIDMPRLNEVATQDEIIRAQVAAADVVLLAKADQASDAQRQQFHDWAAGLFPPRRFVGLSEHGDIPPIALAPPPSPFAFVAALAARPASHAEAHAHALRVVTHELAWSGVQVVASRYGLLDRHASGWMVPNGLMFDVDTLQAALADESRWQSVERFKAVLRTSIEQWHLLQRWPGGFALQTCPWQQHSRIEVQLQPHEVPEWVRWDALWQSWSQRCPVT
jgi:G3E family GTPase